MNATLTKGFVSRVAMLALCLSGCAFAAAPDRATFDKISKLSVPFVPNAGQWDARAAFAAQTFAGTLFVTTQGELVYSLPGKVVDASSRGQGSTGQADTPESKSDHRLHDAIERTPGWVLTERFVDHNGALRPAKPAGKDLHGARVSYFVGNDATQHQRALMSYASLTLGDIYPGIELNLRATGTNVEKIFTVAPNRDPSVIHVALGGATKLEIGSEGELIAHTANGPLSYTAPIAFQYNTDGHREPVAVRYTLDTANTQYGFAVGAYDRARPLVIDPLLRSSYLGAAANDRAYAIAIQPTSGTVYVAGETSSTASSFPGVSGGAQSAYGGNFDAFVALFNADLTDLLQATYLGSTGTDLAQALAIHQSTGDVYVAGYTNAIGAGFPGVSGSAQRVSGGGFDAFVTQFNPDLTRLVRSSYLGGTGWDRARAIAIHLATGDAYIAGETYSNNLPGVSGGAQSVYRSNADAFVARFSADLSVLVRSSYLGAAGQDIANALVIDPSSGDVYLAGETQSTGSTFPGVSMGAQNTYGGGTIDAFVARFSADLSSLVRASYLGAAGVERGMAIAVHPLSGEIFVAGLTTSPGSSLPGVSSGAQVAFGGGNDAFVARFSADLANLASATYLGASGGEIVNALAIHPSSGEIYVAGTTSSNSNFPGVNGGAQSAYGGASDGFIARFSIDLSRVVRSSYLGQDANDLANAVAIQPATGEVYIAGETSFSISGFPGASTGAQSTIGGAADAFVSKFTYDLAAAVPTCSLDIDGSGGAPDAATDGVMLLRALFGFTDTAITTGAISGTPLRSTWPTIRQYLNNSCGTNFAPVIRPPFTGTACDLDLDGSGGVPQAMSDGLMLARAMLGLTGAAVTDGAISGSPPRNTWALIRQYLNDNCGANFAP